MTKVEIELIKGNIVGQLANKQVAPLFIAGDPGTGKSSTVGSIANELGYSLLDVSAPTLSTELLSGLPEEYNTPEMSKYEIVTRACETQSTKWTIPELIADANTLAQAGPTILLLDDFHMIGQHLQSYFFKLLLQRAIGNYGLDDNVVIIGTMNSSEDAGFNGINSAVRNRMAIMESSFNFDYWFDKIGKHLDYRVASFLKVKPNYIQEVESVDVEGYASARAWTAIAESLQYYSDDYVLAHAQTIAGTQVSKAAATAFSTHVKYVAALDFSKLVNSRKMVNLDDRDPIDAIIFPYIINFIDTIQDGKYILDLLDANIKHKSFIGFTAAELYNKHTLGLNPNSNYKLPDGIRAAIDVIAEIPLVSSNYNKASQEALDKITEENTKNIQQLLDIAQEYLL